MPPENISESTPYRGIRPEHPHEEVPLRPGGNPPFGVRGIKPRMERQLPNLDQRSSETRGLIKDYACTCPAAMQYDAPCKHCMALAISYSMKPERFSGYRSHRKPETTPCLAEFIKQSDIARSASFCNEIDIEPTLVYGYRAWSAHFKVIGPNGSYVMKNIADFAERMEQGAYHSYGKNLAFVHTMDAFTPRGKALCFAHAPEPLPRESGLHTRTHGGLGRRKCPRARYI